MRFFLIAIIICLASSISGFCKDSASVILKAQVSSTNPYEGEQFLYSIVIYNTIKIEDIKLKTPNFKGFLSKEIGVNKKTNVEFSGKTYRTIEFSYILIPLISGRVIIEPSGIDYKISYKGNNHESEFFSMDTFFKETKQIQQSLKSEPIAINVKKLPSVSNKIYGDDFIFSGLVGNFRIKTKLDDQAVKIGDSTSLFVVIEGNGNIDSAIIPEIILPDLIEAFPLSVEKQINPDKKIYFDKIIFQSVLIPLSKGFFTIPSIKLNFFDPVFGKYRIIYSNTLILDVGADSADSQSGKTVLNQEINLYRQKVKYSGKDILPIYENINALKNSKYIPLNLYLILILMPFFFYLTARFMKHFFKKNNDPTVIMSRKSLKALKKAKKQKQSHYDFFFYLYSSLIYAILAKNKTIGESITISEIKSILHSARLSDSMINNAVKLFEKIEKEKYCRKIKENASNKFFLDETEKIIRAISI